MALPRTLVITIALVATAVITCTLSLTVGSAGIGLHELIDAARGGGSEHARAVLATRIPRTGCGLLAGAALACAGSAVQTATRNPLADPGILGLTAGAATGVVLVTTVAGASGLGIAGGAFAGALIAAVLVLALGNLGRGTDSAVLLLAGSVVTALALATTQVVALRDTSAFEALRFWSAGSLSGGADITWPIVATTVAGAVLLTALGRGLDALALGDEAAASLGHRPGVVRVATFVGACLLAAGATATTGPIAFVGLAVPHIVRPLVGSGTVAVLAACLLAGPTLLLLADVVGRVIAPPAEVPVGVVTALLGAPLLLAVVRRRHGTTR